MSYEHDSKEDEREMTEQESLDQIARHFDESYYLIRDLKHDLTNPTALHLDMIRRLLEDVRLLEKELEKAQSIAEKNAFKA